MSGATKVWCFAVLCGCKLVCRHIQYSRSGRGVGTSHYMQLLTNSSWALLETRDYRPKRWLKRYSISAVNQWSFSTCLWRSVCFPIIFRTSITLDTWCMRAVWCYDNYGYHGRNSRCSIWCLLTVVVRTLHSMNALYLLSQDARNSAFLSVQQTHVRWWQNDRTCCWYSATVRL